MIRHTPSEGPVLVIGSAGIDLVGRATHPLQPRTSNPGRLRLSHGGVARNVAENLARLGTEAVLISAVGNDVQGQQLLDRLRTAGVDVKHVLTVAGAATGAYLAVLEQGGALHLGLDDMGVVAALTPDYLRERAELFRDSAVVFVDANLPRKTLAAAVQLARRHKVPLAADPTSASLAGALSPHLEHLWLITPNEAEAAVLCPVPVPHADVSQALAAARHLVSMGVDIAMVTMAEFGVGYASAEGSGHLPALRTEIVDPTGAGDALTAAVLCALLNGIPLDEAIRLGLSAAAVTLRTPGTVAPNLSLELLYDQLR
jgi:pseudouridine kinase